MSHIADVETRIRDLDAMETAAERCGGKLIRGQRTHRWYGQYMRDSGLPPGVEEKDLGKCDHAINVGEKSYEVGLVKQSDGSFRLVYDFWAGGHGLEAKVGSGCKKLLREYGIAVVERKVRSLGWTYSRKDDVLTVYHKGGTLKVTADRVEAFGFKGNACAEPTRILSEALGNVKALHPKPELTQQNITATEG